MAGLIQGSFCPKFSGYLDNLKHYVVSDIVLSELFSSVAISRLCLKPCALNASTCILISDGPSLLGLSHITNASMTVNDTALTTAASSRLETSDPIDAFDITVCQDEDLLDGCKVKVQVAAGFIHLCQYYVERAILCTALH